ncbi:glycosyltransferase family 2 protein [Patescibacteria group bacterium]|nr:glycosyltransferase family 2 protein [Patescibacteria group bacterium]
MNEIKKTEKITAIILNYKNYQDVFNCILSLKKQILNQEQKLDILIIDNGSQDDNTHKLKKKFPQYSYIFNPTNLGFARGVNQGIEFTRADSDYFLLVNNDAELAPNCLAKLIKESRGEALAGPAICYKNKPDVIWQAGGFFSQLRMNIINPFKNKHYSSQGTQTADFLSGCVLLIPKKIIQRLGLFDEKFFFYGEDLDYCLRSKQAGINCLYCAEARAWHNIDDIATSRSSAFVLENLAFAYTLILKKHFPKLKIYGYILFYLLYSPFRLYQIIKGGHRLINIFSWFKGGNRARKIKI